MQEKNIKCDEENAAKVNNEKFSQIKIRSNKNIRIVYNKYQRNINMVQS